MKRRQPTPSPEPLPAPDGLSDRSLGLWQHYTTSQVRTPAKAAVLEQALRCLDRASEAATKITAEGLTISTSRGTMTRINPAVKIEMDNRRLAARLLEQLHLDAGPVPYAVL